MKATLELGFDSVYIYPDECDELTFYFVDEAIKRKILSVSDMEILCDSEYSVKWNKFCEGVYANLYKKL